MKQNTTPEQTAKLIELGFTQPRTKISFEVGNEELGYIYSIGELMEILFEWYFKRKTQSPDDPMIFYSVGIWRGEFAVNVIEDEYVHNKELIDALFDTLIKLKEEGVL